MTPEGMAAKYRALIKERMPEIKTAHDDKGHGYVSPLNQKRYKSTTYYTAVIKDPSLANYKMNTALNQISDELNSRLKFKKWFETKEEIIALIEKAKLKPQEAFETAGDFGSQAHTWREIWFREWIDSGKLSLTHEEIDSRPLPITLDLEVISACRAIKRFLKDTGYIPIFCEIPLVDDKLEVGGMADDGGIFPNPVKVPVSDPVLGDGYKLKFDPYFGFVDLKTSNQGKKPAYAYQVRGFYLRMFLKTFRLHPKKVLILHTSKEDGTYQLIDLTDMKFLIKESPLLVQLSRGWDKVIEAFKPKPIIV